MVHLMATPHMQNDIMSIIGVRFVGLAPVASRLFDGRVQQLVYVPKSSQTFAVKTRLAARVHTRDGRRSACCPTSRS